VRAAAAVIETGGGAAVEPDANVLRQVRKAVADIRATLQPLADDQAGDETSSARKALYQLGLLEEMLSQSPERRQPWSYYRPRVDEEFG
jgi:hypothetical protein